MDRKAGKSDKSKEYISKFNTIITDPDGSWTGVPTEDPEERPVQDADDL